MDGVGMESNYLECLSHQRVENSNTVTSHEHYGVLNHWQPNGCSKIVPTEIKRTSKASITGFVNSPPQRSGNPENVPVSWRQHNLLPYLLLGNSKLPCVKISSVGPKNIMNDSIIIIRGHGDKDGVNVIPLQLCSPLFLHHYSVGMSL